LHSSDIDVAHISRYKFTPSSSICYDNEDIRSYIKSKIMLDPKVYMSILKQSIIKINT